MQKLLIMNPKRRKARATKRSAPKPKRARSKRKSNFSLATFKKRTKARRNPISLGRSGMGMFSGALTGVVGATAVNLVASKIPIPEKVENKAGARTVIKLALGVGGIFLGSKMRGKSGSTLAKAAEGSLIYTLTELVARIGAKNNLNLGVYMTPNAGRIMPGATPRIAAPSQRMGQYFKTSPQRRPTMSGINRNR